MKLKKHKNHEESIKFTFCFSFYTKSFLGNNWLSICIWTIREKNKVRLKAEYVKIMDDASYLNISASSRINKKTVDVSHIDILIVSETDNETTELGRLSTDMQGKATFVIKDLNNIKPDTTNTYNFKIIFKGNDSFKKASKSISIKDVSIDANIIEKDSLNFVSALLYKSNKDSVLTGELIDIQVQRLFRPLKIGEEFNSTDENGTVVVPLIDGIPGVDGILTLEAILRDHDDYGTVKDIFNAKTESVIVDESTFDERKMWSPRNKTPLFLLIFPNLLILGMWGLIGYLIINLFKINKS